MYGDKILLYLKDLHFSTKTTVWQNEYKKKLLHLANFIQQDISVYIHLWQNHLSIPLNLYIN